MHPVRTWLLDILAILVIAHFCVNHGALAGSLSVIVIGYLRRKRWLPVARKLKNSVGVWVKTVGVWVKTVSAWVETVRPYLPATGKILQGIAVVASKLLAIVQIVFAIAMLGLRYTEDHRVPLVLIGIPFFIVAIGLWRRRRWALRLGFFHSSMLPGTLLLGLFLPDLTKYGGPSWGPLDLIVVMLAIMLINVPVFLLLLVIPRSRRWFRTVPSAPSAKDKIRLQRVVFFIAVSLFLADYAILSLRVRAIKQGKAAVHDAERQAAGWYC